MHLKNLWDLRVLGNLEHAPQDCKLGTSQERGSLTLSQFTQLISQKRFIEEKKGTMSRLWMIQDVHQKGTMIRKRSTENCLIKSKEWGLTVVCFVFYQMKYSTKTKRKVFLQLKSTLSHSQRYLTQQKQFREISWLLLERALHLPQKLKVLVSHGLNIDVSVLQPLRVSEH